MILIEQTQVPDAALPVAQFRDHLHLGSGFADDGLQDPVLIGQLRAAISAIEGETGKALLKRQFKFVVTAWGNHTRQVLPRAPVASIDTVTITDLGDGESVIESSGYTLEPDAHEPALRWLGWSFPLIPVGGTAEIVFTAGFAELWTELPADLAQAVLLLSAHFYETRAAVGERRHSVPFGVSSICRRYRPVRLGGGGRR